MSKDIRIPDLPAVPAKCAADIKKAQDVFIFFATRFATLAEISAIFMCDQTIVEEYCSVYRQRSYTQVLDLLKNRGNATLRATQFEVASQGDTKMLMFLGKNNLQQVDDNSKYLEVEGADKVIIVHSLENK